MKFTQTLGLSLAAVGVLALGQNRLGAADVAGAGASAPAKVISAEPSSFEAVSRQLDPNGSFYLYLSTETFLKEAGEKLTKMIPKLMSVGKLPADQKAQAEAAWQAASKFTAASGLSEISGFGMSSIAIEKGYYKTKWMLHHYEGKGSGFMWNLPGNSASAMQIISYLPKTTVAAVSSDLTLVPLWKAIREQAAANKEMGAGLDMMVGQLKSGAGLDLDALLAGIGPNYALVLTLDPARETAMPVGAEKKPVAIPEPALALCIQVQDDALIKRVEKELTNVPGIIEADQGEFKVRVLPFLAPLPFVCPAVAWKKGMLIVSSQQTLIGEMLAVKAGKTPGLATVPEFAAMMKTMPTSACQFQLTAPLLQKTITQFQLAGMKDAVDKDPAMAGLMEYMISSASPRWSCSTTQNTAIGWVGEVHGQAGASEVIAVGAVAPIAMMAAIAVPNFTRSRKRSQATRVLEDLRMIDAAIDMYAIENNKAAGAVVKFDEIKTYLKPTSDLYKSNNLDILGNPFNNGKPYKVDSTPVVNDATFKALSDVTSEEFWKPYRE